jgi:hypothetical protein
VPRFDRREKPFLCQMPQRGHRLNRTSGMRKDPPSRSRFASSYSCHSETGRFRKSLLSECCRARPESSSERWRPVLYALVCKTDRPAFHSPGR